MNDQARQLLDHAHEAYLLASRYRQRGYELEERARDEMKRDAHRRFDAAALLSDVAQPQKSPDFGISVDS